MMQVVDSQSRRAFLARSAGGVGLLALSHLLGARASAAAVPGRATPTQGGTPKAKSIICLFQHGGPSHLDLTDPKPALAKWHGQPYPDGDLEIHADKERGNVLASPFRFHRHGRAGMELSELLPHTGRVADELTLVRSMTTESIDHESALRCIHTGRTRAGFPTWGSWIAYALGSECENLPAYVVLSDSHGLPIDGTRNWSSGWLPAVHQGTAFRTGDTTAVANLAVPAAMPPAARADQLRFLERLNRRHELLHPENHELAARIQNFELAAHMQTSVPDVLDVGQEPESIRRLYGLDNPACRDYGTRCLLARRLVEKGVRFVQIFLPGQPWDTHTNHTGGLAQVCQTTDQPSAALVADLKQRGLLDSTIVLWGGEFGRLPISQGEDGRDHNRHGFSLWLAGGGFRAGYVHGATDDFGYRAVRDPVSVHDLHATLLHAMGLDHRHVAYPHEGRPTTLTDADVTRARVARELLA